MYKVKGTRCGSWTVPAAVSLVLIGFQNFYTIGKPLRRCSLRQVRKPALHLFANLREDRCLDIIHKG